MARYQQVKRSAGCWAWAIPGNKGFTLCNSAEPTKEVLERNGMPSTDAVMIKAFLIPATELAELVRREKAVTKREQRCAAIEYEAVRAKSET